MSDDNIRNPSTYISNINYLKFIKTPQELADMDIPDVEHVIDGIVPVGTCILSGREKLGKSKLLLQFQKDLADQNEYTLFLSYEDPFSRMRKRQEKFGMLEEPYLSHCLSVSGLSENIQDKNETFVNNLRELLKFKQKEGKPIRAVMIDTIAHVKAIRGKEDYSTIQKFIHMYNPLAHEFECAIIFTHHTNKQTNSNIHDSVMGSVAYQSACDTVLTLEGTPGSRELTLHMKGKDIPSDKPLKLEWHETPIWGFKFSGVKEELDLGSTQRKVLDTIRSWTDIDWSYKNYPFRQNYEILDCFDYSDKLTQKDILMIINNEFPRKKGGPYTKQEISRACGKLLNKGFIEKIELENDKSQYYKHGFILNLNRDNEYDGF